MLPDTIDDVSRETLRSYERLIRKWTGRINLVSPDDLPELTSRHIQDSLRVARAIPTEAETCADLGSGGGLPGIVIAIVRPDLSLTLVEADRRKCSFLRTVRRELSVTMQIVNDRIGDVTPLAADVITARALASVSELLAMAVPHGHVGTSFIFPKGKRWEEEVAEARRLWTFDLDITDPPTATSGPVLRLTNVRAV